MKIGNLVKGISCVSGAFLLHFSLGTMFTFGNLSPYIASYLKYRTSNTWITNGHMVWVFSITIFFMGAAMTLGGILEKKIGSRITCLFGSWIMSIGTIITYFTIKQNVWLVLLSYGMVYGTGTGITYSVAMAAAMKWFPQKRGLIAGIVTGGFGLGSFIFNLIQTYYINPKNISPISTDSFEKYFLDSSVLNNVPFCFVLIGVMYATMQLIGVILLTDPALKKPSRNKSIENVMLEFDEIIKNQHEDTSQISFIAINPEINVRQKPCENPHKDFSVSDALKNCQLWILFLTFFFNGIFIVVVSSYYKNFGQTFIKNDKFFSIVGAVSAIFNSAGRITWGRIADSVSYRKVMTSLTVCKSLSMSTFLFCSFVTSKGGSEAMYFIWVCWLFFCLSGNFGIFPAITSKCFGNKNLVIIYGFIFTGYSVSGIVGALISTMVLDKIRYGGVFLIATGCSLLSLTLTQFFRDSLLHQIGNTNKS